MGELNIGFIDHSRERSSAKLHVTDFAGDGTNYAAVEAKIVALKAAIALITKCNFTGLSVNQSYAGPQNWANPAGNRELGLKIQYVDVVNFKSYTTSIPGPLLTLIPYGTDDITFANGDPGRQLYLDLINNARSEWGNAIDVKKMTISRRSR